MVHLGSVSTLLFAKARPRFPGHALRASLCLEPQSARHIQTAKPHPAFSDTLLLTHNHHLPMLPSSESEFIETLAFHFLKKPGSIVLSGF